MNREELKSIYIENGLSPDDIFIMKMGGKEVPIITRSGIEKIQSKNQITVKYSVISHAPDNVIIKAVGRKKGFAKVQTFGEASPKNTRQTYPVAMAEKRALSRLVLKITGLYQHGHYGEDEVSEWTPNTGQQDYALELLETAILEEKEYHFISLDIRDGKNLTDIINRLKDCQPQGATGQREERIKEIQKTI